MLASAEMSRSPSLRFEVLRRALRVYRLATVARGLLRKNPLENYASRSASVLDVLRQLRRCEGPLRGVFAKGRPRGLHGGSRELDDDPIIVFPDGWMRRHPREQPKRLGFRGRKP